MRYIDSGDRRAEDALGTWFRRLTEANDVAGLRIQTGFFSADGLGPLLGLFDQLADRAGLFRAVLGSNDGGTQTADVRALLDLVGPIRPRADIGVVRFGNAYFHPKTFHVIREDGTAAAYVGSANLTASGVSSLHVEAGLIADTRAGDDPRLLQEIAEAIDAWFMQPRAGFHLVAGDADLDIVTGLRILGVQRPPRPPREVIAVGPDGPQALANLQPLIPLPPVVRRQLAPVVPAGPRAAAGQGRANEVVDLPVVAPPPNALVWRKYLSASDAQRKPTGNQRGSVTLVAAGQPIDAQSWFRDTLLADAHWTEEPTRTQEVREVTTVPMRVTIDGQDLGLLNVPFSHAPNREAQQNNYTSLLHIAPMQQSFSDLNLTGRTLTLARRVDGTFTLDIA